MKEIRVWPETAQLLTGRRPAPHVSPLSCARSAVYFGHRVGDSRVVEAHVLSGVCNDHTQRQEVRVVGIAHRRRGNRRRACRQASERTPDRSERSVRPSQPHRTTAQNNRISPRIALWVFMTSFLASTPLFSFFALSFAVCRARPALPQFGNDLPNHQPILSGISVRGTDSHHLTAGPPTRSIREI